MKKTCLLIAGVCVTLILSVRTGIAVYPVSAWQQLIATTNHPAAPALPILTNKFGVDGLETTYSLDTGNGLATIDTINALRRWDDNRLLLGVRENGILESPDLETTNAVLYALATNYPDRSLIWINPTNGEPMGLALHIGLQPVPLDPEFIYGALAAGDTDYTNQNYFSFDISEDGYIYTGYKNKLLRYGSDGNGGIDPVPTVCLTLTTNNATWPATPNINDGPYGHYGAMPMLHVRGAGTNTVIVAGGMAIRKGWRFYTLDGTNFLVGSTAGGGQGGTFSSSFSMSVPAATNASSAPGEEWIYGTWYPENNGGGSLGFRRWAVHSPYQNANPNFYQQTTNPAFLTQGTVPAGMVTSYDPYSIDPNLQRHAYNANFIGAMQTRADLDYMVVYSAPPWNSLTRYATDPDPFWQTSWLALHDRSKGTRLGTLPIDVRESDGLFSANQRQHWLAIYGYLSINKLGNGDVEILVANPVYGYGRYLVKSEVINITNVASSGGSVDVSFSAETSGNAVLQLQRSTDLTVWTDVGTTSLVPASLLTDPSPLPDGAFYRVKLNYY